MSEQASRAATMQGTFTKELKRLPLLMAGWRAAKTFQAEHKEEVRTKRLRTLRKRIVGSYLSSHSVCKLQIGVGPNALPGWLNTDFCPAAPDIAFLDATQPFPLQDSTFSYVYSEHLIEHLTYEDGLFMLRECLRIFRPAGRIRIATPELTKITSLSDCASSAEAREYLRRTVARQFPDVPHAAEAHVINNFFYNWGHRFLYDVATLKNSLLIAGFREISRWPIGVSSTEELCGVEFHGKVYDEYLNAYETMIFEAAKP